MAKVIKITLLSIICVALVGFMIMLIQNGFNFKNIKRKLILNETYEAANINKIKVESRSSDINIYEAEDDKFKVEIYGDESVNPEVKTLDGVLSIDIKNKSRVCFGICLGSKVNIYVPTGFVGKFDIETKSGDINSDIKSYNDYEINVTSGDISLNNVKSLISLKTGAI